MLLDLPSNRQEGWRWSDLSALPDIATRAPAGTVPEELPWIDCEREGPRLVFVDGKLAAELQLPAFAADEAGERVIGGVGVDVAFESLRTHARGQNAKLGEVAERLVRGAIDPAEVIPRRPR